MLELRMRVAVDYLKCQEVLAAHFLEALTANKIGCFLPEFVVCMFLGIPRKPRKRSRPKAATFVEAVNTVKIEAVKTVAREFPWDSLGRADSKFT